MSILQQNCSQGGHKNGGNEGRCGNSEMSRKVHSYAMNEQSQSSEDSDLGVFTSGNVHYVRSCKSTEENTAIVDDVSNKNKLTQNRLRNSNVSLINVDSGLNCENVVKKERTECESEGDSPRRPSNDSATSNSDSQQSGDEYNVYYYKGEGGEEAEAPPPTGKK